MTANPHPAILGLGQSLPPTLRGNDDPIFDWIRANDPTHGQLFTGYVDRHVLAGNECIEEFVVAAATVAGRAVAPSLRTPSA